MKEKFPPHAFILAGIRNKPGRNLATVFCFAFIAANIFSAQYLTTGAAGSLDTGVSRIGADMLVIPTEYFLLIKGNQMGPVTAGTILRVEPSFTQINASVMDRIGQIPDVASMSPQLYVASLAMPEISPTPVDIYGIDPVTDFTIQPWLRTSLKNPLSHGEIIAGNAIGADPGSRIVVGDTSYTVVGKLDSTKSGVDRSLFMPMDDAYALAVRQEIRPPSSPPVHPGSVSAILIRAEQGTDPASVEARVQQQFPYAYLRVIGKNFSLQPVSRTVQGLPGLLNIISIIVILAALPLITLISAMAAHERQQEIGLLMSMGAKRVLIFFLALGESLILAIIGGITGVVVSLGFLILMEGGGFKNTVLQGFSAPSAAETLMMAAFALGVVVLIGSIASLWPAYRSSRMNPYDAIRNPE